MASSRIFTEISRFKSQCIDGYSIKKEQFWVMRTEELPQCLRSPTPRLELLQLEKNAYQLSWVSVLQYLYLVTKDSSLVDYSRHNSNSLCSFNISQSP
ncbi:hypothetical protein D8674_011810 [Pyrus ussuriensis x Pyrus communis]|uniref:Uncharacterized protein n=1 Tax=Pyrus ussuriensis x Pyrus communis TaxID=2448454 RepID=A0A5N5G5D5_9ROSA|nr:hypothetical protein D8674_011810 [Pyrus ussuriensis x Pyrus communis]